ncbi:ribonuclease H-like domain-containing protein [Tanacetum coccineum]
MATPTCEIIWLRNLLFSVGLKGLYLVEMFCDSSLAIQIAANPVFHERTKHFELDVHLVREKELAGVIKTSKINTDCANHGGGFRRQEDWTYVEMSKLTVLEYLMAKGWNSRILIKLLGSISNWSSRMLYKIKKSHVMVDVARGSRLGAWLRACCLFILPSKSRGVFLETDIQEKDKKKAKNDKTKHGMEKTKSNRSQSQSKSKKSTGKSTPTKSKVNHMEKIQLEGLKLPNLKLYYKNKKTRAEIEKLQ